TKSLSLDFRRRAGPGRESLNPARWILVLLDPFRRKAGPLSSSDRERYSPLGRSRRFPNALQRIAARSPRLRVPREPKTHEYLAATVDVRLLPDNPYVRRHITDV